MAECLSKKIKQEETKLRKKMTPFLILYILLIKLERITYEIFLFKDLIFLH